MNHTGKIAYENLLPPDVGACIVHPDKKNVTPLCPEIILNQDGNAKNDCERNASKRFLENFRREHPHLKAILVEDGLSSTAPYIRMIEEFDPYYCVQTYRRGSPWRWCLFGYKN